MKKAVLQVAQEGATALYRRAWVGPGGLCVKKKNC